jgi:hypothetical protein
MIVVAAGKDCDPGDHAGRQEPLPGHGGGRQTKRYSILLDTLTPIDHPLRK